MSEGKRKRTEIADGSTSSSARTLNGSITGMSNGTATSSTVAGNMDACTNIHAENVTVNHNYRDSSGAVLKPDPLENAKRFKSETRKSQISKDDNDSSSVLSFINDPDGYVSKIFVSSDCPQPGTIDYTLKLITEQLEDKPGSIHCFSTPRLISTLGLRRVGQQPDCVTHHFVMIKDGYRPVVFAVTKSQDDDVEQYLQRLSQSVTEEMRRHSIGPVIVAGESLCKENLTHKKVNDKLELHKQSSSPVSVAGNWINLLKSCATIRYLDVSEEQDIRVETSVKELDTGPLNSPPMYTTHQRHFQDPDAFMTKTEFESTLRIMGSEKTMFIDEVSTHHKLTFGLEMAYRLNQDGGTLLIGNPGKEIPSEVCKEVISEQPTTFNDKNLVLGCRHVVVFLDRKKDLDKYKTILRGGGKLLVFLPENGSSGLSFYSDPVNKIFVSSDCPQPGTIDYTLKVIIEQLEDKPGSIHCFSTPRLISTLGLRGVGQQPDCITHHFVMIKDGYRPIVFAVTKSQDDDVEQYLQRLSQSVTEEMRRHGTGPVIVAGENICKENLTHKKVNDKLELHKQSSSSVSAVDIWRSLIKSCSKIRLQDVSEDEDILESSVQVLDTGLLSSPPMYTTQQRQYPDAVRTHTLFEATLRIMGSERTLFIGTETRGQRRAFGLEIAYRLNQDGGTLFIGNPGKEIPSEVCKEVISEQPTSFNDKDFVFGCRHVVVFVDRKEDLDKYKTILRGGGKLLLFLCENGC